VHGLYLQWHRSTGPPLGGGSSKQQRGQLLPLGRRKRGPAAIRGAGGNLRSSLKRSEFESVQAEHWGDTGLL